MKQKNLEQLKKILSKQSIISLDTETTGLGFDDGVVGISIAWSVDDGIYLPIAHEKNNYSVKDVVSLLKDILEDSTTKKVFHNFYFDCLQLRKLGLEVNNYEDTKMMAYLLDPEDNTSLAHQCKKYKLKNQKKDLKSLIKVKGRLMTFDKVDVDKAADYSSTDAKATHELYQVLNELIGKTQLYKWYQTIELPLAKILADMTWTGIEIDKELLKKKHLSFNKKLSYLTKLIYEEAGEEFNLNSPQQLRRILYHKLGLPIVKRTNKGDVSTDNETLEQLVSYHPIIEHLIEYRKIKKLDSTYTINLIEQCSKKDGRLHTTFSQLVTATGRLASNSPNLQNIPAKDEEGRDIRKAFVAKKGYSFVIADYSQIELKVGAFLAGEQKLYDTFLNNGDVHKEVADRLFPNEKDEKAARLKAKKVNFGILYGMGNIGLAKVLGCHPNTAKKILNDYYKAYPRLKDYAEEMANEAKIEGRVTTISGRRRLIQDIDSSNPMLQKSAERKAVNTPVQGSAADIIKIAMVQIDDCFKKNNIDAKIVLQVHDELVIETNNKCLTEVKKLVEENMTHFKVWNIPSRLEKIMSVSINTSKRWEK